MKTSPNKLRPLFFLILHSAFCILLVACANPLNREPGPPPTPTPPFARESAAVATAEASGDAKARADALYERGNAKFDAGKLEDAIAAVRRQLS